MATSHLLGATTATRHLAARGVDSALTERGDGSMKKILVLLAIVALGVLVARQLNNKAQ